MTGRALLLLALFAAAVPACLSGSTGMVLSESSSGAGGLAMANAGDAGEGNPVPEGGSAGAGVAEGEAGRAGSASVAPRCPTRFERACSPEIVVDNQDAAGSGQLFDEAMPDPKGTLTCITRDVCSLLFRKASEIRNVTRVRVVIEDYAGISEAFASGPGEATIHTSSRYLQKVADAGGNVQDELTGVFYYHAANIYQNDDGDGVTVAWMVQGVAEFVRYQAGYLPDSQRMPGGNYDDGYATTGFFLVWLDSQYPDFVYSMNQSMSASDPFVWSVGAFKDITGQNVGQLWAAYQATL